MQIKLLDHGFIRFIEKWGTGDAGVSEAGIIEAARQSTQGSFRGWEKDEKLLRFLYEHKHSTPFEFAGMVLEIKAPIVVFREWHRHRTQSYSEASARYAPLPDENYLPTAARCLIINEANKQAGKMKDAPDLEAHDAEEWLMKLERLYGQAEHHYQAGLKMGVPKELARLIMPVGHYSQMRACCNLRNWLAFLTLRMDPSAQWEIQQFAKAVAVLVQEHFPRTYALFQEDTGFDVVEYRSNPA